ncbi:MAG: hypothetical protein KDA99_23445 [Planctomycetales bacterium]|nr:hypothetical protein [Planctomycetales bacterium]
MKAIQAISCFVVRRSRRLVGLIVVAISHLCHGHEGPPFPVVIDQSFGEQAISVWADPDIGEATFYVSLNDADGRRPRIPPRLRLWVQPKSGRLLPVLCEAQVLPSRDSLQFVFQTTFDQRDYWVVRIFQELPSAPDARPIEWSFEVESTPPGYDAWDLLIYLFPFAFFGIMWIVTFLRRAQRFQT